jgi:DNA-binding transcriptional MerR regulator
MTEEGLTIGAIARLAGVTVRALHHYHRIGLVVPEERTDGGYRLYGRRQVERLQEVLFFRELDFGLDEIRRIVDQSSYDRAAGLARQRTLLVERAGHLQELIEAVDAALDAEQRGTRMTNEEMLEVFGDFDPSRYEEEARQRWGDTEAYRESARRTSRYSRADWERIKQEGAEINEAFLALMARGVPATDPAAAEVAERHRAYLSRWFYECTPEIQAGLGQMYAADPRFTESIDRAGPGLAAYMSEAIAAHAGNLS